MSMVKDNSRWRQWRENGRDYFDEDDPANLLNPEALRGCAKRLFNYPFEELYPNLRLPTVTKDENKSPSNNNKDCICEREVRRVFCEECGKRFIGRIYEQCPIHKNVQYLMDFFTCPNCAIDADKCLKYITSK